MLSKRVEILFDPAAMEALRREAKKAKKSVGALSREAVKEKPNAYPKRPEGSSEAPAHPPTSNQFSLVEKGQKGTGRQHEEGN